MDWLPDFNCRQMITPPSDGLVEVGLLTTKNIHVFTSEDGITKIEPFQWRDGDCLWLRLAPGVPIYMYYNYMES